MSGLLCFLLGILTSPFKSKMRLEAEKALLRLVRSRPRCLLTPDRGAMHLAVNMEVATEAGDGC